MARAGKKKNNGPSRRIRRIRPGRAKQVVVVQQSRPVRGGGRRGRGRATNRGAGNSRGGGAGETFTFTKDDLKGDCSGVLKFGPSLSEYSTFSGGVLKSYHEYKITSCVVEYVTEASSTLSGSIAYETDPHCKLTSLASKINKFTITKSKTVTFRADKINGTQWRDTSEDQFHFLFKGNGEKEKPAGSFKIKIAVRFQNPK